MACRPRKPQAKPPAACCTRADSALYRAKETAAIRVMCHTAEPAGAPTMADAAILTPRQRAWRRFAGNRRGWWSLWIFLALFGLSLFAELLSNDKPIVAHYQGEVFSAVGKPTRNHLYGDFRSPKTTRPFIRQQPAATATGRSTRPTPTALTR